MITFERTYTDGSRVSTSYGDRTAATAPTMEDIQSVAPPVESYPTDPEKTAQQIAAVAMTPLVEIQAIYGA